MQTGTFLLICVLFSHHVKPIIYNHLVIGSDDEVLTPIFEKNDVEIAVSASHDTSRSSKSKKHRNSSRKSRYSKSAFDPNSLLKLNLDLPSIQSNPVKPKSLFEAPIEKTKIEDVSKVEVEDPKANLGKEKKSVIKNVQEKFNFNLPFADVDPEDFEIAITKPAEFKTAELKSAVNPGTIIAGKPNAIQPGTVIASKPNSIQSGVVIAGKPATIPPGTIVASSEKSNNPSSITALAELPFDTSLDESDIKSLVNVAKTAPLPPGTVITTAPGTVITSSERRSSNPGQLKLIAELPFGSSSDDSEKPLYESNIKDVKPQVSENKSQANVSEHKENKLPVNPTTSAQVINKPAPMAKHKKIRSLEEHTIQAMAYDHSYNGPKIDLKFNITAEFVNSTLIPYFKSGKNLDRKSAYSIFFRAYQEFLDEETLHDITLESDENIIILGDIHGQFPDFLKVIEKEGLPNKKRKYLFNGDIVDRGAYSVECLLTLLAFKVAEPGNFFVSLGNHETESVGKLQFHKESVRKYGNDEFFKLAHSLFKSFPVAYLIQNEVFVTHGGITPEMKLDEIRDVGRFDPDLQDQELINDLIWSDPVDTEGYTESHRGLGLLFGPDVTKQFVTANNISVVIRSHQYKEFGFSEQHEGLCITIFSCPKYKGKLKNYGAYIRLDSQLNLTYIPFKAADLLKTDDYPVIPNDLMFTRNVRRIN